MNPDPQRFIRGSTLSFEEEIRINKVIDPTIVS
jgi:hypothetical protein